MRILDAVRSSTQYLERSGVEDAFADAELIVLHAAGMDRLGAYLSNPEIGGSTSAKARRLIKRRAGGEPVQYIVGCVDFMGLRIHVGKGVLIPRPETEFLAQAALEFLKAKSASPCFLAPVGGPMGQPAVLDLCTGSGCLALAIAKAFPDAQVYGTDISGAALRYARKNAEANGIRNIIFLKGSLFAPLKKRGSLFDLIVSNPPYVRRPDIAGLQREIRDWEPLTALDGGEDGLDFYKMIFSRAADYLGKEGCVIVEVGFDQAGDVGQIAKEAGFGKVSTRKDLAGIETILQAGR